MVDSLEAGHILTLPSVHTIADGIQVKTPGDLTFEMCRQYVDKVVAVSENEIAGAILSVLEKQKLVAEGAGASPPPCTARWTCGARPCAPCCPAAMWT